MTGLETERLLLQLPKRSELDAYMAIFGDPAVQRRLPFLPRTREATAESIERMLGHWERHGTGLFSVVRKEDELLLGRVGFLLWNERWLNALHHELEGELETEIGWTIGSEHWNRGYATEAAAACRDWALGELGLTRLVSLIAIGNTPSVRVAEKIGERLERTDLGPPFEVPVDLYSLETG
ncbi:MAG: GNAT family N-acetyltransferase [Gaiellaceae bacterium]